MNELEIFWANMLSRVPERIRAAWQTLTPEEQIAIAAHLKRMVSEEGWADPQRASAQAALSAINDLSDHESSSNVA
ncbi:MAG: hypothetical protein JXJ20_14460 [Anaerolineae bacterium]|nr:hypothetical protein [Anaerolineae bacterium]